MRTAMIIAGLLFVIGGAWELYPVRMDLPLIPLVCVLAGVVLLARALIRQRRPQPG